MVQHIVGTGDCEGNVASHQGLSLGTMLAVSDLDVVVPLVEGDSEDLNRPGLTDMKERFLAWFQRAP